MSECRVITRTLLHTSCLKPTEWPISCTTTPLKYSKKPRPVGPGVAPHPHEKSTKCLPRIVFFSCPVGDEPESGRQTCMTRVRERVTADTSQTYVVRSMSVLQSRRIFHACAASFPPPVDRISRHDCYVLVVGAEVLRAFRVGLGRVDLNEAQARLLLEFGDRPLHYRSEEAGGGPIASHGDGGGIVVYRDVAWRGACLRRTHCVKDRVSHGSKVPTYHLALPVPG